MTEYRDRKIVCTQIQQNALLILTVEDIAARKCGKQLRVKRMLQKPRLIRLLVLHTDAKQRIIPFPMQHIKKSSLIGVCQGRAIYEIGNDHIHASTAKG